MQYLLCFLLYLQPALESTEKIDSLNQYAFGNRYTSSTAAYEAALLAEKLSLETDYSDGLRSAMANLVILHAKFNEDTLAIKKLADININDPIEKPNSIHGYLLMAAGKSNYNIGLEDKAGTFYEKGIVYFEQTEDHEGLTDALADAGSQLARRGHFAEGLSYFRRAYMIAMKHDLEQLPDIYRYMANVYNKLGDHEQAKAFVWKNLNNKLIRNDDAKMGDGYHTLAGIYAITEEDDSAMFYYYKALDHYDNADDDLGKTYVHANLAEIFNSTGFTDSAKFHLNQAKEHLNVSDAFKRLGAYLNFELAKIYRSERSYHLAEAALWQTIRTTEVIREMEMLRDAWLLLSEVKEENHQYDSALYYFQMQKAYSDSLINETTERKYANLRVQLETMEKENEIATLNQQLKLSRVRATSIVMVLALTIVIIFIGLKYYSAANKRNKLAFENSELIRKGVENKLKLRERELADFTLNMIQKNQFLEGLEETIKSCRKKLNGETPEVFNKLLRVITVNRSTEKDWHDFNKYFGNVHQEFFDKIKETYPALSSGDLRHCALLKMNLSIKESAEILGIDPNSIKMARYRMKRKMGLREEESLGEVVAGV